MAAYVPDPAAAGVPPDPLLEASSLRAGLSAGTARTLAFGAALYRRGLFWEAHEAWEQAWTREQGQTRQLLQGLILLAAAFHQAAGLRQSSGCVRLLTHALEKLAPLGAQQGGLQLDPVRSGAAQALALAVAWHEGRGEAPTRLAAPALESA